MNTFLRSSVLLLLSEALLSVNVLSQERRLVVVSPHVGAVIDAFERTNYRMFQSIKNFHSASFYQAPDSTMWVAVRLTSPDGNFRDSTFVISFEVLLQYAEMIDHWKELLRGGYRLGSSQPSILYEDGTVVHRPSFAFSTTNTRTRRFSSESLPLASNSKGLPRPKWQTIHLDLAVGISTVDFSNMNKFVGGSSNAAFPFSVLLHLPLDDDGTRFIISGWSFSLGGVADGSLSTFSAAFAVRTSSIWISLDLLIGLGIAHARYSYSRDVIINATSTYPFVVLGGTLVPQLLDFTFAFPFVKSVETVFETVPYSLWLGGPSFAFLLSL